MKKFILIASAIVLSATLVKANSITIINPHACSYIIYVNAVGWVTVSGNTSPSFSSMPGEIINSARITYQTMASGGAAHDGLLLTNIWTPYTNSTMTGAPVPYCGYNSMISAWWDQPTNTSDITLIIN
ncbi:hypothetical protein DBR32_13650 [Taibaiella sp. KBW10]|uniref:hypothetical protein n=1 Tax=Taibaiella sp. KBW10 TaxID=2153357 RepID=UPI000F5B169D|nr:hypothetical protein [Taibaiella sp. KBW10]RQO29954.1 hypothetical protein DBR32_13650 [Taibaiella sp. KBW10]